MIPRFIPGTVVFALLACGGRAQQGAPSNGGGAGGAAGEGASAGSNFRPPVSVIDPPLTVGASPVKCAGTPQPDADIVRACLLFAACAAAPPAAPLSECIAAALPRSPWFTACQRDARSCADVATCLGTGVYTERCPKPGAPACVGDKLVYCDTLPNYFIDCAKRGVRCLEGIDEVDGVAYETAYCGVPACDAPTDDWVCDGAKRVHCANGYAEVDDCSVRGLDCIDKPDGAICGKSSGSCTPLGVGTCDSDSSGQYCDVDGRAIALACAPLGFTCHAAPNHGHGIACLAPDCAPEDAAQCFEECDGPVAHLCIGGQRLSIDCASQGLSSCVVETRAGVGDRARCGK